MKKSPQKNSKTFQEYKREIFEYRQQIICLSSNGLVEEAQKLLEYIITADKFSKLSNWIDEYYHLLLLERQGKNWTIIRTCKRMNDFLPLQGFDIPTTTTIRLSEQNAYNILFGMILMRAHEAVGNFNTAEKFATSLLNTFDSRQLVEGSFASLKDTISKSQFYGIKEQDGLPEEYYPPFRIDLFKISVSKLLESSKRKRGESTTELNDDDNKGLLIPYYKLDHFIKSNSTLTRISLAFEIGDFSSCFETLSKYYHHNHDHLSRKYRVEFDWLDQVHAVCQSEMGKMAELFSLSQRVAKEEPESAKHFYMVGLYQQLCSNQDEARRNFIQATKVDEMYSCAWMALGHSYAALGDHDQAVSSYARIVRFIDSSCPLALVSIASEYIRVGKPVLASPYLHSALNLNGNDPYTLNELGILFYSRGELSQALDAFTRSESLFATSPSKRTVTRNRILTSIKLTCQNNNENGIFEAIRDAQSCQLTRIIPFILELSYYLAESEEGKHFFLSEAILRLSHQPNSTKSRNLLQNLIAKSLES